LGVPLLPTVVTISGPTGLRPDGDMDMGVSRTVALDPMDCTPAIGGGVMAMAVHRTQSRTVVFEPQPSVWHQHMESKTQLLVGNANGSRFGSFLHAPGHHQQQSLSSSAMTTSTSPSMQSDPSSPTSSPMSTSNGTGIPTLPLIVITPPTPINSSTVIPAPSQSPPPSAAPTSMGPPSLPVRPSTSIIPSSTTTTSPNRSRVRNSSTANNNGNGTKSKKRSTATVSSSSSSAVPITTPSRVVRKNNGQTAAATNGSHVSMVAPQHGLRRRSTFLTPSNTSTSSRNSATVHPISTTITTTATNTTVTAVATPVSPTVITIDGPPTTTNGNTSSGVRALKEPIDLTGTDDDDDDVKEVKRVSDNNNNNNNSSGNTSSELMGVTKLTIGEPFTWDCQLCTYNNTATPVTNDDILICDMCGIPMGSSGPTPRTTTSSSSNSNSNGKDKDEVATVGGTSPQHESQTNGRVFYYGDDGPKLENPGVYVCLTCTTDRASRPSITGFGAGLCRDCAEQCHHRRGHAVEWIGHKREAKCDCIAAGTPVSLANGLSIPIEELANNINELNVLSYDIETNGIVEGQQTAFYPKGERKCVQLTLSDGRTLVCTPDHLIRTTKGDVKAADLVLNKSKIICGAEQPVFTTPIQDELDIESKWTLTAGDMKFTAATAVERNRAMIFSRIVGAILTDGSIKKAAITAYLGHQLDVDSFVNDIKTLVPDARDVQIYFDNNTWNVSLPLKLSKAIRALIDQQHHLPDFVTTLPKSLLREFLGGLFGGDGSTVYLDNKLSLFGGLGLRARATVHTQDRLKTMINEIKNYLGRFGIDASVQVPCDTSASKKNKLKGGNKKVSIVLLVANLSILQFGQTIGFRYCCHKSARLTAAMSWLRLQSTVESHNDKLVAQVYDLCGYEGAVKNGRLVRTALKMRMQPAYRKAKQDGNANGAFLSSFITLTESDIHIKLKKVWNEKQGVPVAAKCKRSKYLTKNPRQWLTEIGAIHLFEEKKNDSNVQAGVDESTDDDEFASLEAEPPMQKEHRPTTYAVPRGNMFLPTMTLTVVDSRPVAGLRPVYDITVPRYHLFVANGIVVHNCGKHDRFRYACSRSCSLSVRPAAVLPALPQPSIVAPLATAPSLSSSIASASSFIAPALPAIERSLSSLPSLTSSQSSSTSSSSSSSPSSPALVPPSSSSSSSIMTSSSSTSIAIAAPSRPSSLTVPPRSLTQGHIGRSNSASPMASSPATALLPPSLPGFDNYNHNFDLPPKFCYANCRFWGSTSDRTALYIRWKPHEEPVNHNDSACCYPYLCCSILT
jgi:intein/homing endonuclease